MIRLGVVGHGARISSVIRYVLREVDSSIRVVGIVDPDETNARARLDECDRANVTFYKTLGEMVRKGHLDALAIGTRCHLHAPYAIQAAKYDLPLYLEKPVAINMGQAIALEKAFLKSKCQVVVSFPLRVSPLCELTRKYIAANSIGEPVHINAFNYVPYGTCYWTEGYRNYKITQGLFLQKATHDFDYMMFLMNMPITRVGAMATWQHVFGGNKPAGLRCSSCNETRTCLESPENSKRNGNSNGADHFCLYSVDCGSIKAGTNEDCSSALVEFASGAHGIYTQVFFTRKDAGARGAIISGYHGTLKFDWYQNELKFTRHHLPFSATEKATGNASHFGGDIELAYDFIGLIKGTIKKSRTPIATGIQSVYACLAAKESSLTGKFVKVRQTILE